MYKYILTFPTETGTENYYIQTNNSPKPNIRKTHIPYMSFTGNPFPPLEIIFIMPLDSGDTKFLEWINFFEGENYDNYTYARPCKKDIILTQTDPTGYVVEKWTLVRSYLDKRESIINSFENLQLTIKFNLAIFE